MPQLQRYSPTKLWDGAEMAIFGDFWVLHLQRAEAPHFRPAF